MGETVQRLSNSVPSSTAKLTTGQANRWVRIKIGAKRVPTGQSSPQAQQRAPVAEQSSLRGKQIRDNILLRPNLRQGYDGHCEASDGQSKTAFLVLRPAAVLTEAE